MGLLRKMRLMDSLKRGTMKIRQNSAFSILHSQFKLQSPLFKGVRGIEGLAESKQNAPSLAKARNSA
jgi:hypothetical protein